ncbi:hypothetical protein ANTHELSMS3_04408 [Antarctobacter heliothermus]|uniref:Uncharacterized protein n=1 Tax=Antarctobacter heliothermus TaxID=74033 RepID=A0A222E9W3_9RHOB|nr:hypothetical protein [Antarctobacter heliothermus]ASP23009.1 hypothetical protein ANTHELSMS3_04408 [Antarctobacter heliothermus]
MRSIVIALVCSLCASAASAGPLTCWYNSSGAFTGADGGSRGLPETQWGMSYAIPNPDGSGSGDYAYVIILPTYDSGNDCPESAELRDE